MLDFIRPSVDSLLLVDAACAKAVDNKMCASDPRCPMCSSLLSWSVSP
jgi:hypothetical protein